MPASSDALGAPSDALGASSDALVRSRRQGFSQPQEVWMSTILEIDNPIDPQFEAQKENARQVLIYLQEHSIPTSSHHNFWIVIAHLFEDENFPLCDIPTNLAELLKNQARLVQEYAKNSEILFTGFE